MVSFSCKTMVGSTEIEYTTAIFRFQSDCSGYVIIFFGSIFRFRSNVSATNKYSKKVIVGYIDD